MRIEKAYGVLLVVLTLLGSCVKEQGPKRVDREPAVEFMPSLESAETKTTSPTSTALSTTIHFGVFGFEQEGVAGNPGTAGAWSQLATKHWTPAFMYNVEVYHNGSAWTYSPAKQWPSDVINTITFWAYAPYSSSPDLLGSGTDTAYGTTSVGLPDVRYTVTDGSEDLLLSALEQDLDKEDGTVQFLFHHALSQIRFFAKKVEADPANPRFTVTLTSVRLDGLKMTAVHRSGGWTDYGSTTGSITLISSSSNQALDTDYPGSPYATVMPLPQTFTGSGATLHLTYTIKSEDMLTPRTAIHDIPLEDIFTADWEEENQYTLKIKITPDDPIEFTVTWSSWGSATNYNLTS